MGIGELVLLVVGGVLLLVVVLSVVTRAIARGVAASARAAIAAHHPEGTIVLADDMANSFGVESKGVMQLRGNGGLVLTRDELHFVPLAGGTEVRFPLRAIRSVGTVRSHLGKTIGRSLLKIEWQDADRVDAIALHVRDVQQWVQRLETARR